MTPFLIAQTVVMVLFIITGIAALRKFHPPAATDDGGA